MSAEEMDGRRRPEEEDVRRCCESEGVRAWKAFGGGEVEDGGPDSSDTSLSLMARHGQPTHSVGGERT